MSTETINQVIENIDEVLENGGATMFDEMPKNGVSGKVIAVVAGGVVVLTAAGVVIYKRKQKDTEKTEKTGRRFKWFKKNKDASDDDQKNDDYGDVEYEVN